MDYPVKQITHKGSGFQRLGTGLERRSGEKLLGGLWHERNPFGADWDQREEKGHEFSEFC